MKRFLLVLVPLAFLSLLTSRSSAESRWPLWGPEVFSRGTGKPKSVTRTFKVPSVNWEYTLVVRTPDQFETEVAAASIRINGEMIVSPSDFVQHTREISKSVHLQDSNEMTVWMASKPNTSLAVSIFGPTGSAIIPADGGTVSIDGVASVDFPPGAFPSGSPVTIAVTASPETDSAFLATTDLFLVHARAPYEVRLHSQLASTGPFIVRLTLPPNFVVPLGYAIRAFVEVEESGGEDILEQFEVFPSAFDSATRILELSLPPWVLTDRTASIGTFETVIIVGTNPAGD